MALTDDQFARLIRDLEMKLQSRRQLLEHAEGRVTITLYPKGTGYDIKINLTT